MSKLEEEDAKVRRDMQALGRHVDRQLPYGWGFVVLAFPFGAGGRMNYVANAEREDVVRAMYEFIEATKEKWAAHLPDLAAAAEDERLARAQQRVAELEGKLKEAVHILEVADRTLLYEAGAHMPVEILEFVAKLKKEVNG